MEKFIVDRPVVIKAAASYRMVVQGKWNSLTDRYEPQVGLEIAWLDYLV